MMNNKDRKTRNCRNAGRFGRRQRRKEFKIELSELGVGQKINRPGVVLLVTLVLLVVLSTLGYTLSSRVAAQRHRDNYIINYQAARYGCDSALKFALATLSDINTPQLIDRPNEPDFSDLFLLNELEYQQILTEWAYEEALKRGESLEDIDDVYDITDDNGIININRIDGLEDPNFLRIPGPYGPAWPLIVEPTELEIGDVTVKIEIEDENAKYPIGWAMLDDEEIQREAEAAFETFCEWMDVDKDQIDSLKDQLQQISDIRPFELDLKPITISQRVPVRASTRRRARRGRRQRAPRTRVTKKTIPVTVQIADFAKLFHGSIIDTDALARPTVISETRKESALKYIGMWASRRVNINTAPRQVLEATFTFGGDAREIAEEIIELRRITPFENVEDLRKALFRYSDSIEKCEKYITTASTFFTIKITAVSGVAKTSTVIAVMKDKGKWERIAVISG